MSAEVKHCCRMDTHLAHLWWSRRGLFGFPKVEYFCHGLRIHEGGFGVHVD